MCTIQSQIILQISHWLRLFVAVIFVCALIMPSWLLGLKIYCLQYSISLRMQNHTEQSSFYANVCNNIAMASSTQHKYLLKSIFGKSSKSNGVSIQMINQFQIRIAFPCATWICRRNFPKYSYQSSSMGISFAMANVKRHFWGAQFCSGT